MTTPSFRLLEPVHCDRIRAQAARGSSEVPGGYGPLERINATGRARCRCCGKQIPKGTPVLRFGWDRRYASSYTATTVQICAYGCRQRNA